MIKKHPPSLYRLRCGCGLQITQIDSLDFDESADSDSTDEIVFLRWRHCRRSHPLFNEYEARFASPLPRRRRPRTTQ